MQVRKRVRVVGLVAATALAGTGCLSEGGGGGGGGGDGGGDGTVEIIYGFGGDQSKGFEESLQQFQQDSGITIKLTEASQSFDTLIRTRVQANNVPDIALFPQPGVLKDFVAQDRMKPLSDVLDVEALEEELVPGILEAASVDGEFYGAPVSMNVKSLVFYPKKAFESAGYEVPQSLDELEQLTQRIKQDGTDPWCLGMESSSATGWVATDWIEDLMLRIGGPEKYDQWVTHEIPFNSPEVEESAQAFERIAIDNAFGGRQQIVSNNFATAANPMFDNPPKCFLHKQGNFITQSGFFPENIVQAIDEEVGVFYFPAAGDEKPVLGGGDLAGVFEGADEAANEVMEFITGGDYPGWSDQAGFMSPRPDYDRSKYSSELMRQMAGIAYDADVFRFDGSDQMPGAVGSGSFWKEMVAWVSGQTPLDQALQNIEQSWPS